MTARALAAGYPDLPALLESMASEPIDDPRGLLSESELVESLKRLEAADLAIENGDGIPVVDAIRRVAAKYDLALGG